MIVPPGIDSAADTAVGLFSVEDAREVAESLMDADDPTASAAGNVEPDSPLAAQIAVERLDELLHDLPAVVKRALSGAERNADRLSDDRLQGLAELIQNADDVAASTVTFTVEESARDLDAGTRLVSVHDGAPLRMRDVVAMAVPWLSMKSEDATKVGEFGIGLMTLRSLSDTLDVHCGHFHLRFGARRMSYLTDAADYPTVIDGQTVFCIPVGPGVVDVGDLETWLAGWGDAGLLFLSSVKSVELVEPSHASIDESGDSGTISSACLRLGIERGTPVRLPDLAYSAETAADSPARDEPQLRSWPADGATFRTVVTEAGGAQWAVYSRTVMTPQVSRLSDKPVQDTTPVAVAFRLPGEHNQHTFADRAAEGGAMEEGAAEATAFSGMIHVGLPVRRIGLPFRVGAPFEPLTNRRDLPDSAWNQALISEVSDLWRRASVDAFSRSAADGWATVPLASEVDNHRPLTGRLQDVLAERLLDAARTRMAEELIFPTEQGGVARFDQMAVEHPDLSGVIGQDEVNEPTGGLALLTEQCRDRGGRWRQVLAELHAIGAPAPRQVEVADARPTRSTAKASTTARSRCITRWPPRAPAPDELSRRPPACWPTTRSPLAGESRPATQ